MLNSRPRAASNRLDMTFAALANPTRRAILARLTTGEGSVSELAAPFSMSQPAISRHPKVLEQAGLISTGSDAQRRPRKLEARPLAEATAWLERYRAFWATSFDLLAAGSKHVLHRLENLPRRLRWAPRPWLANELFASRAGAHRDQWFDSPPELVRDYP